MSVASAPKPEASASAPAQEFRRGLTLRSFITCIFALLLMGVWVEFEEVYAGGSTGGGPLAENSPPNSAVLVLLIVIVIGALIYRMRRSLRLTTAELVFIYAAMLIAAPLMTQGLWQRFFGLLAAFPHEQDFKTYESMPVTLWPHGDNLCANPRFQRELQGFTVTGGTVRWESVPWKGKDWRCPVLDNGAQSDGRTTLAFSIPRTTAGNKEQLIPGEAFLLSFLLKTNNFAGNSSYYVTLRADDGPDNTLLRTTAQTAPTFALPGGFQRVGVCPVAIPRDLQHALTISIGIKGPGSITLQDLQFFNSQAIEGAYAGRKIVRSGDLHKLKDGERDFTLVKPNNMFSPAGLKFLMTGYIPWQQWVKPLCAWSAFFLALFLGMLGLNTLMRKQWVEDERLTLPINILPRQLLGAEVDQHGEPISPSIFRNRVMWAGFAVTLPLVLLKGIHYYNPSVPDLNLLAVHDSWFGLHINQFINDPLFKTGLANVQIVVVFSLLSITLLIEKDILFSIWVSYLLFQLYWFFGKAFNFNGIPGYPWQFQQGIGAYIGYALLALFAARRHLVQVFRKAFGRPSSLDDTKELVSFRIALLFVILSLGLMVGWAIWMRMGYKAGLLFACFALVTAFASSKIRAESGPALAFWAPYKIYLLALALGGFAVFGSTGMLMFSIFNGLLFGASFFFLAPVQLEMVELARHYRVRFRDIGYGLLLGLLGGILIGGFAMLCWSYKFGGDNFSYTWAYNQNWYYEDHRTLAAAADGGFVNHALTSNPATRPLDIVHNTDAKGIAIGLGTMLLLGALRTLFTWFPLHPVGYLLATTAFGQAIFFSCFLAWLVRLIVLRVGGAHTVRKGLVPFAVGMFLACLASIIIFDVVALYLHAHGVTDLYTKWP